MNDTVYGRCVKCGGNLTVEHIKTCGKSVGADTNFSEADIARIKQLFAESKPGATAVVPDIERLQKENARLKAERDELLASVAVIVKGVDEFYMRLNPPRYDFHDLPIDVEGLPQNAKDHIEYVKALEAVAKAASIKISVPDELNGTGLLAVAVDDVNNLMVALGKADDIKQRIDNT